MQCQDWTIPQGVYTLQQGSEMERVDDEERAEKSKEGMGELGQI
jgi:hypothetical protein